jgi:Zn-dependent membrane protease YugP
MFGIDPISLIITLGTSLIGGLISSRLKSKFQHYSQIRLMNGKSGREIAEAMLRHYGITDVQVVSVPGFLSDHYNPMDKTVNLSPDVFEGRSIAAAAVAAHECGHAVQHATAYSMLKMRSAIVPIVNIASTGGLAKRKQYGNGRRKRRRKRCLMVGSDDLCFCRSFFPYHAFISYCEIYFCYERLKTAPT